MLKIQGAIMAVGEFVLALMPYVNGILGLLVVGYIIHRLLCCAEQYNGKEKFGMSLIAGGMIMATPALWMVGTPYDQWSFNVARGGLALYIITGGMRRDRHARRNREAADQAAAYLAGKGKS